MTAGGTAEARAWPKENTAGHRIVQLWAFVAIDDDGDEGLPAFVMSGGRWLPMVCSDEARVESLRGMARALAEKSGQRIELRQFRGPCEVLEVFGA